MRLPRLLPLLVALAPACTNGPTLTDAGTPDARVLPYAEVLFAPCEVDWQCEVLGEGAFCRTSSEGPAGGYCTRHCVDRTPCEAFGAHHHCLTFEGETEGVCVPACRNGADCPRAGYTCFGEIDPTGDGYCQSICSTDEECGGGAICNLESGMCQAPPIAPLAGFDAPCGWDYDCTSSFCVEERTSSGTATGYIDGACRTPCILPAGFGGDAYYVGDTLPNAGCPGDASCLPGANNAEGDLGTCYPSCALDADCRAGMGCLLTIGTHTFTRGVCVPIDCTGGTCPSGRTCIQMTDSSGNPYGRCG